VSIYEEHLALRFNGGRHRSRWLVDVGVNPIPLALSKESISLVNGIRLIVGEIKKGDLVDLPITIDQLKAEQYEYDNLCNYI